MEFFSYDRPEQITTMSDIPDTSSIMSSNYRAMHPEVYSTGWLGTNFGGYQLPAPITEVDPANYYPGTGVTSPWIGTSGESGLAGILNAFPGYAASVPAWLASYIGLDLTTGGGSRFPLGKPSGTSDTSKTPSLSDLLNIGNGSDAAKSLADVIAARYAYNAAKERTDLMREQANKYDAMGAPYRQKLAELYADPTSYMSSAEVQKPVQMGTDMLARSLSTQGNPIGSGNALQQLQDYSSGKLHSMLGSEKERLAGLGGLSAYTSAAPQAAQNAIGSQYAQKGEALYGTRNVLNDIFGTRMYGV